MRMKKKLLMVAAFLIIAGASEAYSLGIGIEGGAPLSIGGLPGGQNVMLSLKLDGAPLLGLGLGIDNGGVRVGVIADFWLLKEPLVGILGVYLGPGAYGGFDTGRNLIFLGARLPIGLQIYVVKWLELFLEVAPSLGFNLASQVEFGWGVQAAVGIRFWI